MRGRLFPVAAALTFLVAVNVAHAGDATPAPGRAATPAAFAGVEIPGAVPVSLLIHNRGETADVLLGGSSPIAERVEVHRTRLVSGQRAMAPLPDGLPIPPGTTIILEPGRDHLMLYGLREPLVQGQTFPLTLRFANAGDVTVTARVRRKLDAAQLTPIPAVMAGGLSVSLVSAPPAPAGPPR
jgi:copper(I)-binding protein